MGGDHQHAGAGVELLEGDRKGSRSSIFGDRLSVVARVTGGQAWLFTAQAWR
jgi:hypothetical protein